MPLPSRFRRLAAEQSGTIVILFALLLVPIAGLMAGAIDFARQLEVQQELQQALDSASLAAAKYMQAHATGDPAELPELRQEAKAIGTRMFLANFKPTVGLPVPQPNFAFVGDRIAASADVDFEAAFLGILGISKLGASGHAEAVIPGPMDAEIVLVLDYSGSMNTNNKYGRMATAAKEFIAKIKQNAKSNTRIGIVPFSKYVYVTMKGANIRDVFPPNTIRDLTLCIANRDYPYSVTDETPRMLVEPSRWVGIGVGAAIAPAGGIPILATGGGEAGDDDDDDDDDGDDDYRSSNTDAHRANEKLPTDCQEYADKNVVVHALTSDFDSLVAAIGSMAPIGLTNIALAAEIGWHLLTSQEPYIEASYPQKNLQKVLVLLTDGVQTVETTGPDGSESISSANDSIEEVCRNMTRAGVIVFAIAYDLKDSFTQNLLLNCASKPENFFDAQMSQDLTEVFIKIYDRLVESVRLAR